MRHMFTFVRLNKLETSLMQLNSWGEGGRVDG